MFMLRAWVDQNGVSKRINVFCIQYKYSNMKRCPTFIGVWLRDWEDLIKGRKFNFYAQKYYIFFLNVGCKIANKLYYNKSS